MTRKTRLIAVAVLVAVLAAAAVRITFEILTRCQISRAVADLAASDPETQQAAVDLLATSQSPYALRRLVLAFACTHRDETATRALVVKAMIRRGPEVIEPMLFVMNTEEAFFKDIGMQRELAPYALERDARATVAGIGAPAVEKLLAFETTDDSAKRAAVARLLGCAGDQSVVPVLLGYLDDKVTIVRLAAIEGLGELKAREALAPLIETLASDPSSRCRRAAARVVGAVGGHDAVEPLIAALADEDSSVRAAAACALGWTRDEAAVAPLIKSLSDCDDDVVAEAALALSYFDDTRGVEPLVALLSAQNARVRAQAAWTLGYLGDTRAVEPVAALLADPDDKVRLAATEALARFGDSRAVEPALAILNEGDFFAARRIVDALEGLDDPRLVDAVVRFIEIPDNKLKRYGILALERLGTDKARAAADAHIDVDLAEVARESRELIEGGVYEDTDALIAALWRHGTLEMAADFYWSGHRGLRFQAMRWARSHGIADRLKTTPDSPDRPKWGKKAEASGED